MTSSDDFLSHLKNPRVYTPLISISDIIRDVKNRHPEFPLAAYQVSGEYAMLMKSADAGIIDLKRGVFEAVNAIRRAGCDIVISYFTPKLLEWIDQDEKDRRKLKAV